jgi:hypothetical protein
MLTAMVTRASVMSDTVKGGLELRGWLCKKCISVAGVKQMSQYGLKAQYLYEDNLCIYCIERTTLYFN